MNLRTNRDRASSLRRLVAGVFAVSVLSGCNLDSFFNPSVTGYWEHQPTTIPILERIDVIEQFDDPWGQTSEVEMADLVPSDLTYRAVPGDIVTVGIFELFQTGGWSIVTRRVDAGGYLRVPELGDIPVAGQTPQEMEDMLAEILRQGFMDRPQVDVVIEQGGAFYFTLYGHIAGPGQYTIINPDLRLMDAIASAGGLVESVDYLYVIRQVALSEEVRPIFERERPVPIDMDTGQPLGDPPVDIEGLIDQLEQPAPANDAPVTPLDVDAFDDLLDPDGGGGGSGRPSLGVLPQDQPRFPDPTLPPPPDPGDPVVDIDDVGPRSGTPDPRAPGSWMYLEERGEWVRVPGADRSAETVVTTPGGEELLYVERIIKIPAERLTHGDSRYNIVVRPKDRIYVEPPTTGVVYIDGEITRPGTFNLPQSGLTLSRLVAAAGGLGPLAIPERVDLVRKVSDNREAVIRLNLGAIRQRTEPDVLLKPDDHIIIGTNFWAVPLAIVRSGFRATYGFGFLLDRNFGNDVFGAPPSNVGR